MTIPPAGLGVGGLVEMLELQERLPYSIDLQKKLHNSPNIPQNLDFISIGWS